MDEELNLAEFTKGGEPVVSQEKTEEPTKESEDISDEKVESSQKDESAETDSQKDESAETTKEETLKSNESSESDSESVVQEKPEEKTTPTETESKEKDPWLDDDFSDFDTLDLDKDTVELAKSLDDDYIKKAVQYYNKNKDLRPFLEAYQYDYDKVGNLELLRLKFERENPELSPKAKDRLFKQEVLKKYYLDNPDEHEEEDKEFGKELMQRDADKLRGQLKTEQQDFIPKNVPKQPSEAEMKEAVRNQRKVVRNNLKDVIKNKSVTLEVDGLDPLNYEISDTDKLIDYAVDTQKFLSHFQQKDGSVDWGLWSKTIAFIENPSGFLNEVIKHGKSLGKKAIESEIKNQEPLVTKKEVEGESMGTSPLDDPTAFLKSLVKN